MAGPCNSPTTISSPAIELAKGFFFKRVGQAVTTKLTETKPINDDPSINSETLRLLHHEVATHHGMAPIKVLAPGIVTTTAAPKLEDINPCGNTSGGVTFTYADTAMAAAAQSLDLQSGKIAVTTKATIQYSEAVKPGEKLSITATTLTPVTNSRVTVGSVIKNEQGKTVFSGAADFYYTSPEKNSSSTITDSHQTWSERSTGDESLSIANENLSAILAKNIRGKPITLVYSEGGDLVDGLEIIIDDFSDKPPLLFIEFNSSNINNKGLRAELESLLQVIKDAEPSSINVERNDEAERGTLVSQIMQEFFSKEE